MAVPMLFKQFCLYGRAEGHHSSRSMSFPVFAQSAAGACLGHSQASSIHTAWSHVSHRTRSFTAMLRATKQFKAMLWAIKKHNHTCKLGHSLGSRGPQAVSAGLSQTKGILISQAPAMLGRHKPQAVTGCAADSLTSRAKSKPNALRPV